MASARLREPTPVRWGLRLLAIVYVFLLVLWPVSLVVKYTFADGLTALDHRSERPRRAATPCS